VEKKQMLNRGRTGDDFEAAGLYYGSKTTVNLTVNYIFDIVFYVCVFIEFYFLE
jgi:hypothetical protein